MSPAAPAADLRAWITAKLDPVDASHGALHSDYDMNPHARPGEPLPLRPAAVLVPLVMHDTGLTVLLTRRSDTLRKHTGQIAFPVGASTAPKRPWRPRFARRMRKSVWIRRSSRSPAS